MKVVSTEALTKLIQLVKSAFIKVDDVVKVSEIDTETTTEIETEVVSEIETETPTEITLATVATSGSYTDLNDKPTVDQTYDSTSTNAQSGVAIASVLGDIESAINTIRGV